MRAGRGGQRTCAVFALLLFATLTGCAAQGPQAAITLDASPSTQPATVTVTPIQPLPSIARVTPVQPLPSPKVGKPSQLAIRPSSVSTSTECPPTTGKPIRSAPGNGKTVALTFDDGPGPQTLALADALAAHDVAATFFVTGQHAQQRPEVVRELASRGHLIASHTLDHRYPKQVSGGWTRQFLEQQIIQSEELLRPLTAQPACFFRPPGGLLTNVADAAQSTGTSVVLWSIDSQDWRQPDTTTKAATAAIVKSATAVGEQAHPVVLFHDFKASHESDTKVSPNRSNTIAALPAVIDWYQRHGYEFVRLDGVGG